MLELKDATLSENGRIWFANLSFVAAEGQLTCVTGEAGKSALAAVLLGFTPLTEGYVSIDGALLSPQSVSVFRRQMAYIPQEHAVTAIDSQPETGDLESVWSAGLPDGDAFRRRRQQPVRLAEVATLLPPLSAREIIIADDPAPAQFSQLRRLADEGRTVVVMSCREEYVNMSDQLVRIEHDEHFLC